MTVTLRHTLARLWALIMMVPPRPTDEECFIGVDA